MNDPALAEYSTVTRGTEWSSYTTTSRPFTSTLEARNEFSVCPVCGTVFVCAWHFNVNVNASQSAKTVKLRRRKHRKSTFTKSPEES